MSYPQHFLSKTLFQLVFRSSALAEKLAVPRAARGIQERGLERLDVDLTGLQGGSVSLSSAVQEIAGR